MDTFADFFSARRDIAYRAVLMAVGGDRATAEDAVAEAFARAYQHWRSVRDHANPTAWVIRTALNVSRSWWRRHHKEFLTADGPETSTRNRPDPALSEPLLTAVRRLSRRQREVVALRVLADLSAEETGQLLGITPATVHVHLHRALAGLRETLGPGAAQPLEVTS